MPYFWRLRETVHWPKAAYYGLLTFAALIFVFGHVADALHSMRSTQSVIHSFLQGTIFALQERDPEKGTSFLTIARNQEGWEYRISATEKEPQLVKIDTVFRFDQNSLSKLNDKSMSELEGRMVIELLRRNVEYGFSPKKLEYVHLQKFIAFTDKTDREAFRSAMAEMNSTAKLLYAMATDKSVVQEVQH